MCEQLLLYLMVIRGAAIEVQLNLLEGVRLAVFERWHL
jgi:hypothetical protein